MRIAHVSDIHIRNFKYRDEYRAAFDDLYRKLDGLRPDLIINTGDTVHSKLAVSPELFDDVARHMLSVCEVAPYWIILGNHDLNLKNKSRMDAISPITKALQGRTANDLSLLGHGTFVDRRWPGFRFVHYDIRQGGPSDWHFDYRPADDEARIGLFHGSVTGCMTDLGFTMEHGEVELSRFDDLDYVLMGDIHRRQSFRGGRAQYAGSLIQQNYGEDTEKGFLVWDIEDKRNFEVRFVPVKAPGRFYTIQVPQTLDLDGIHVPSGSRIKAVVGGELTPSKRLELERKLRERFSPLEVITPATVDEERLEGLDVERLVESREQMMVEHLRELGCDQAQIESVIDLWTKYRSQIDEVSPRGTTWSLKSLSWDNMLNYAEGNSIDVERLRGLVGIFAPNASGKSSIFDIMCETLYDKLSKDAPRNIDLINDNKDSANMRAVICKDGDDYTIDRTIERITYGQRKLAETKQWGKTSLDFSRGDESLNGGSRPETERAIRALIGTFEDFAMTTMVSQNPIFWLPGGGDIINCKETDRRKILFKFLDLDVYEKVNQAAKDDLKEILGGLKNSDRDRILAEIDDIETSILTTRVSLSDDRLQLQQLESNRTRALEELSALEKQQDQDVVALEDHATILGRRAAVALSQQMNLQRDYTDAQRAMNEHSAVRPEAPDVTLEELAQRMTKLRAQESEVAGSLSKARSSVSQGKRSLKTLDGIPCEGKFPTCKFVSEAYEFLSQKELLERTIAELEKSSGAVKGELADLESYEVKHRSVSVWESEHNRIALWVERSKAAFEKADELMRRSAGEYKEAAARVVKALEALDPVITERIAALKGEVETLNKEISAHKGSIESCLRRLGALDSKIQSLREDLDSFDEKKQRVSTYEMLVDLTGKSGLPYRILTLVLPLINSEIEKILAGIVRFSIFFDHDEDEQSVSLSIRYGDYRSRPLSLGSGAEKFIASLAIRAALLSVSSLPKTDILIVDEGFGKLDPEHLEAVQRIFEYLKGVFGTVFLVSHVDTMRDMVDHSLEITSLDGYAHLEA